MTEGKERMGISTALAIGGIALDGKARVLGGAGGSIRWNAGSLLRCV